MFSLDFRLPVSGAVLGLKGILYFFNLQVGGVFRDYFMNMHIKHMPRMLLLILDNSAKKHEHFSRVRIIISSSSTLSFFSPRVCAVWHLLAALLCSGNKIARAMSGRPKMQRKTDARGVLYNHRPVRFHAQDRTHAREVGEEAPSESQFFSKETCTCAAEVSYFRLFFACR